MTGTSKILFHADGSATTGSALWFLIVFGIVGALTTMIVSFALPIGPWWLWLLANAPFVWLARWEMRRSAMTIDLLDDGGVLRLKLTGRGVALDEEIRADYDCWTNVVNRNPRYGGLMLSWNVVVQTRRGRRIGFKSLGGAMKDRAWPERRDRLPDGSDTYSTFGVFGLVKALDEARARSHAAARVSRG